MIAINQAWLLFVQQCKSRDNLLLLLTLFFLAYYLCLISLVGNSVQQHLQYNLQQLLGADSVLSTATPLTEPERQQLLAHSSALTETQHFSLNLVAGERWQKTQMKAVGAGYPLTGTLRISRQLQLNGEEVMAGPAPGEIWLDPRGMAALALQIGDSLQIAGVSFVVGAVLLEEPDRLLELHSAAARAMLNSADLPALAVNSEQRWRYLMRNTGEQQQQLATWAAGHPQWQWLSQQNGQHPLAGLWLRVQKFAGLTTVLLFLLGAITLDLIGKKLARQQQYYLAVCLANGMTRPQALLTNLMLVLLPTVLSLIAAVLLAIVSELLLIAKLGHVLPGIQSWWHWSSLAQVSLFCLLLFVMTQLPVVVSLLRVQLKDLLREQPPARYLVWLRVLAPLSVMLLLVGFYADNWHLTALLSGALATCMLGLLLVSWLTLWSGEKLTQRSSSMLAVGFYMMRQRLPVKSAQIIGIGLSLTLLMVTLRMSGDVLTLLEQIAKTQDGNLVIDRANPVQRQALEEWVIQQQAGIKTMQPFVDAKLIAVNSRLINDGHQQPSDTLRELEHGVRIHWSPDVPVSNQLTTGDWQATQTTDSDKGLLSPLPRISVEDEVAQDLALQPGDVLLFHIGQHQYQAQIASLHRFKPGAGSVTFWFVVQGELPAAMQEQRFYMGSAEIPEQSWPAITTLWQKHPSLSMVPFAAVKQRLQQFSDVGQGLVLVFSLFMLGLSVLLVLATIRSFTGEDRKRNGLLLSFGLSKQHCLQLISTEWLLTALLPVLAATFCTVYLTAQLYQLHLGMPYQPGWFGLLGDSLLIVLCIAAAGVWLSRDQLKVSIRELLLEQEGR